MNTLNEQDWFRDPSLKSEFERQGQIHSFLFNAGYEAAKEKDWKDEDLDEDTDKGQ